ncbi:MAG: putative electron transfer flavoprotein FixA [Propionibacteriaceae bacterium]|jgi:electron transfer flavoprotein beta subunit|nr:putative electron transfer flavoprotein FixA [Propionibacteriaceae bacterium]
MKIIAAIKVSAEAQDIEARPDRTLNFDRAQSKIGAYDLNAVEAARQLADTVGGEVIGLSVGTSALANSKVRKDALSRGLDQLDVVASDEYADLDSFQTAQLLQSALQQTGYDLVLVGAGSSDVYAQQVGNQLGALLGVPTLNAVNKITPEGDHLVVERLLEDAVQVIEVPLPAVLSVTSGINTPRIAGMKEILAAGKKPVNELAAGAAPAGSAQAVSTLAPEQVSRQQNIVEGDPAEAAAQLAAYLKAL